MCYRKFFNIVKNYNEELCFYFYDENNVMCIVKGSKIILNCDHRYLESQIDNIINNNEIIWDWHVFVISNIIE